MATDKTLQLRDQAVYPDENVLQRVLKKSYSAWKAFLELLEKNEMTHEWRFYNDGNAWLCKVQKKKRTIVWLSVWDGLFKTTTYFPAKYLDKLFELDISEEQKEKIRQTKDVGKSKPCTFEIKTRKPFAELEKVIKLKMECK